MRKKIQYLVLLMVLTAVIAAFKIVENPFFKINANGNITYFPDEKGNVIPDFSRVGYHQGNLSFPKAKVVKILEAPLTGDSEKLIQDAINEVARFPLNKNGLRGTILLKKGKYIIPNGLFIKASGIILKGEGDEENGTKLVLTSTKQQTLITVGGDGVLKTGDEKIDITDEFVPVGAFSFHVKSVSQFKAGDEVIVYRPATQNWITDIKMDQIQGREGTIQWDIKNYNLSFERKITKIVGNTIFVDNPIVMQMDKQYGGGQLMKYTFNRISEVGIEGIRLESTFAYDTDEKHGWVGIGFGKAENCWVNQVTSRYFGFGCVDIRSSAKYITVNNSKCLEAKSIITGNRRYSFHIDGQLNLVINCQSAQARHDYATGARVCGPNVFCNSTAKESHSDIGPHQRWAIGTLYDNIISDGLIDVEDRGDYGTGHGWAGVTQVLWNCAGSKISSQSPWASGKNYAIGVKGERVAGRFADRPQAAWFGENMDVAPKSLYLAQLNARKNK